MAPRPTVLLLALSLASVAAVDNAYSIAEPTTIERSEAEVRRLYESWRSKHSGLLGGDEEEEVRFGVFKDNLRYIDKHNAEANTGRHSFRLGLNRFADLTNKEFRAGLEEAAM